MAIFSSSNFSPLEPSVYSPLLAFSSPHHFSSPFASPPSDKYLPESQFQSSVSLGSSPKAPPQFIPKRVITDINRQTENNKSKRSSMEENVQITFFLRLTSSNQHACKPLKTMELFREMQLARITPDDATMASAISSCAQMCALKELLLGCGKLLLSSIISTLESRFLLQKTFLSSIDCQDGTWCPNTFTWQWQDTSMRLLLLFKFVIEFWKKLRVAFNSSKTVTVAVFAEHATTEEA